LVDRGLTKVARVRKTAGTLPGWNHCPSAKMQLHRPPLLKFPILVSMVHLMDFAKMPQ
jgi:hypothetical protein